MSGYLHGVKIMESAKTPVLAEGDSSVIALVGTAPVGAVNEVILITSKAAAVAEFGEDIGGFTIPAALDMIFSNVAAKVLVVNVLPGADAEALMGDDGTMTLDESGKFVTRIGEFRLPVAADFSGDIIDGIALLDGIEDSIGIKPDLIIAPGYSQLAPVMAKMDELAKKINGFAIVDMAIDPAANPNIMAGVLTARASGTYATSSSSVILAFPPIVRYNGNEQRLQKIGLSVAIAIAKVATDATVGYWISPSNYEVPGILSTEVKIRSSLTDPTADTNMLNAQGIMTVLRRAGSGYRVWGNWTSSFPTEKTADVMIAPRAVRMMIREALIDASINYMDRNNITKMTVEMIQNSVNAFLRNLIGKGAINDGACTWDAEKNPASEVSQGKLLYTISVTYGPSLESLTFEEVVETNYNL